MKDITTGRFTVRTDVETELMVRHEYELFRQEKLADGRKALSLNGFIIQLILEGLEMEIMCRRNRAALLGPILKASEGSR